VILICVHYTTVQSQTQLFFLPHKLYRAANRKKGALFLNSRYQPYRYNRCSSQNNGGCSRIAPYSDMSAEELSNLPLAMAYVPWQVWGETYDAQRAFCRGTIFPQLDLPFGYGG